MKTDNSTQKLLNLIRDDEPKQTKAADYSSTPDSSLPPGIKARYLNCGVLIARTSITLVVTTNKSFTQKKELIKWHYTVLPENLEPDSKEFPAFLKKCLNDFLGNNKISIWCALDSSNLKIKKITIPNIANSKISNAAFWGLKKETEFDEKQEIFSYEILDDFKKDGIKKKNLLVFTARKNEIQSLKETFKKAGYFLTGITAIPFAMQNYIRTGQIQADDQYFAIVNISREISEIYCFSQSGILLGRTIRAGTQSLINDLDRSMEMDPIDYISSMAKKDSELFSQIRDSSTRLVSKIARTGDYCSHNYTGDTPIKRYFFYGETDSCKPFMDLVSNMIPASIDLFEPIRDNLTDSIEMQLPRDAKKRNCVLSAFGIGLSDNDITPNFLFTSDDRRKIKIQKRVLQAVVLAGILLLAACFTVNGFLNYTHKKKVAALNHLDNKIGKFQKIPKEFITQAIANAQAVELKKQEYTDRYIPLAVIHDICNFTPDNIYLASMTYEFKKEKKSQEDME
ncbi:MAG: hypothetical protein U9N77_04425, partial [Thermodesulfobacteriota bacterium]|nr:hypothetical protein [Thermodesulfobacteriota bacterium]